jgi:L-malate glycosyltransferase
MENAKKDKKLKIGFVSVYHPQLSGVAEIMKRTAAHLAKQGHEVHFIGHETNTNPKYLERLGIKLHKVKRINNNGFKHEPYEWTLASKIVSVVNKYDIDILHAQYAIPHALSTYIAAESLKSQGKKVPYVITGHGSDIHTFGNKRDFKSIFRLCVDNADAITYVSKGLQKIAEKKIGLPEGGIWVTNTIDENKFFPKPNRYRNKLKIPKNAFVIGHASSFHPVKQVYHFFELAKNLKEKGELGNTYFLMCGDGIDKKALIEKLEKNELIDHFKFTGNLNATELKRAYNAMDVFILPSQKEGCPLVALEAMSCEIPIIATRTEGLTELIHKDFGLLFKTKNFSHLTRHTLKLKKDKRLRTKMGKNAREQVIREHSISAVVNKYLEIYHNILGKEESVAEIQIRGPGVFKLIKKKEKENSEEKKEKIFSKIRGIFL